MAPRVVRWTLGPALLLALALALAFAPAPARSQAEPSAEPAPRCFGAAARDPFKPCLNPKLRFSVWPRPALAQLTPNQPCTPTERDGDGSIFDGTLQICEFGVPRQGANGIVALIGDSHAMNWRAPVEIVAQQQGWVGLDMTRSHCPFSKAVKAVERDDREGCTRFKDRVVRWFHRHPEVRTIFVAHQTGGTPVIPENGASAFETAVSGFQEIWAALPPSVEHIVVLRDNPGVLFGTFGCIRRAQRARRRPPGSACALPRLEALHPDPAFVAARRLRSKRVQIVNLTRFMCGRSRCLPVVGGVLVNKDTSHLTRVFATTLGPYLARRVKQLMQRW